MIGLKYKSWVTLGSKYKTRLTQQEILNIFLVFGNTCNNIKKRGLLECLLWCQRWEKKRLSPLKKKKKSWHRKCRSYFFSNFKSQLIVKTYSMLKWISCIAHFESLLKHLKEQGCKQLRRGYMKKSRTRVHLMGIQR